MARRLAIIVLLLAALGGSIAAYLYVQVLTQAYREVVFDIEDVQFSPISDQVEAKITVNLHNPSSKNLYIPSTEYEITLDDDRLGSGKMDDIQVLAGRARFRSILLTSQPNAISKLFRKSLLSCVSLYFSSK